MKILCTISSVFLVFALFACTGSVESLDSAEGESVSKELSLNHTLSGSISSIGEVDWYHYRAVEANRMIQVAVSSNTNARSTFRSAKNAASSG